MAGDPEAVRLGAGLNDVFAATLRRGQRGDHPTILAAAGHDVADYLAHFPS